MQKTFRTCIILLIAINYFPTAKTGPNSFFRNTLRMIKHVILLKILRSNVFITPLTLETSLMNNPTIIQLKILFSCLYQFPTKYTNIVSVFGTLFIFQRFESRVTSIIAAIDFADNKLLK